MKNILTPLSIIAIAFISCKNEEKQTPKVVVPFYQVANQQNQTLSTPQPNQGQSLYPATSAQNTTTQVQTTAPVKVAKGMNPSHGQPGHRCDIAVGAPLNSPVAPNVASPQVVSNTSTTVVPSTAVVAPQTGKGMNPPHGQPGHRCDIPVGAPLNSPIATSKPVTPQVTPNYIVSPPTSNETPVITPAETAPPVATPAQ